MTVGLAQVGWVREGRSLLVRWGTVHEAKLPNNTPPVKCNSTPVGSDGGYQQ